jgi:hypothetical protein
LILVANGHLNAIGTGIFQKNSTRAAIVLTVSPIYDAEVVSFSKRKAINRMSVRNLRENYAEAMRLVCLVFSELTFSLTFSASVPFQPPKNHEI